MAKTRIKIYIPGEVIRQIETYTFANGRTVSISKAEKLIVPSKKNQQRIAVNKATLKPILLPSAQHEKWHKSNLSVFKRVVADLSAEGVSLPLSRVKMKLLLYFPDSKERDLPNKLETIADIMEDAGLILNDSFQVFNPITIAGWTNRAKPRTEIFLTIISPSSKEHIWDVTPANYFKSRDDRRKLLRQVRDDKKRQQRANQA